MTTDGPEDREQSAPPNQPEAPAKDPSAAPANDPVGELRERITSATEDFLKARLGLEQDPDGTLRLPERGVFENVGQRADQFLRGFLRGVIERTPEEREVEAGLRDKADVPGATEVVGRLLSKASDAVSSSFHQYLKDNVTAAAGEKPVVVDGRFLLQHGAPLLAGFVQALGQRFAGPQQPAEAEGEPAPTAAPTDNTPPEPATKVDYKVDLPSLLTSLFVRPKIDEGGGS